MTRLRTGNRRAKRKLWWRQWDLVAPMGRDDGSRGLTASYAQFTSPAVPAWALGVPLHVVWVKTEGETRALVVAKRRGSRSSNLAAALSRVGVAAARAAPAMRTFSDGLIQLSRAAKPLIGRPATEP